MRIKSEFGLHDITFAHRGQSKEACGAVLRDVSLRIMAKTKDAATKYAVCSRLVISFLW
jgi:hypothetical protein